MAVEPQVIPIGDTGLRLDAVEVDTAAGANLLRETVVSADPENPEGLAKVTNTDPPADAYGLVVRLLGQARGQLVPVEYDALSLGYTGEDLTSVVYTRAGTTVATLTLSYTAGKLTGVART